MVTKQLRMARDHGVAETIVLEGSREGSLEEVSNKLHFRESGVKGRVFQANPAESGNKRSQHSTAHIFLLLRTKQS